MKEEELIKKILEISKDSKISCREALKLAAKADIPTKKMAKLLDKYKIKIRDCQLGCF